MSDHKKQKLNNDDLNQVKSLIGDARGDQFSLDDILAEFGSGKLPGRGAVPLSSGPEGPDLPWPEARRTVRSKGEKVVDFPAAPREEPERFDRERLARMAEALPEGVRLAPIGEEWYPALMARSWSRDLCGNFRDGADFVRRGLGVVALRAGEPVAGAASYAVCGNGIEVEIDTDPRFRRRGLARACGAKLILDCLDRGLFPGWDAHDRRSLALAEQLGYRLDRPYPAFWVEEWAKGD